MWGFNASWHDSFECNFFGRECAGEYWMWVFSDLYCHASFEEKLDIIMCLHIVLMYLKILTLWEMVIRECLSKWWKVNVGFHCGHAFFEDKVSLSLYRGIMQFTVWYVETRYVGFIYYYIAVLHSHGQKYNDMGLQSVHYWDVERMSLHKVQCHCFNISMVCLIMNWCGRNGRCRQRLIKNQFWTTFPSKSYIGKNIYIHAQFHSNKFRS